MEAHLTVVAESRDRIPAPCKYCKAAAAEAAKKRKGQKATHKIELKMFKYNRDLF